MKRKLTTLLLVCGMLSAPASAMAAWNVNRTGNIITITGGSHFNGGCNNNFDKPEPTKVPSSTAKPQPTKVPSSTAKPQPTNAPSSTAKPQPTKTPEATEKPQTPPQSSELSAMEQEVLRLVNQQRAANGLSALAWAEDVAAVARAHSRDMIANNYFSHMDKNGNSPFDRLRNAGITYRTAAENIAYGQKSAQEVMNSWMNSAGHRANILNSSVKEIGIGAARSANGTIYWTQMFVAR